MHFKILKIVCDRATGTLEVLKRPRAPHLTVDRFQDLSTVPIQLTNVMTMSMLNTYSDSTGAHLYR
eukprot:3731520-Prymnesium_polylepis.2